MSTALTTSGGKALPALPDHIKALVKAGGESANSVVKSGLGSGFVAPPQINIRGSKFRIKIDGEETMLTRKDEDGESVPIPHLNVVVLAANEGKHKTFYMKKYDKDAEPGAPDCYSYDGERPSMYAQSPQAKTCATCPKNVFGSAITEQGKKTRACGDAKILAVMAADGVKAHADPDTIAGMVFQMRVSATALNRNKQDRKDNPTNNTSLLEYVTLLDNYPAAGQTVSVPLTNVVTRLFLDKQADYPLLRFRLGGFLTEDDIAYVAERAKGEDVQAIITDQGSGTPAVVAGDGEEEFEQPAPAAKPAVESKLAKAQAADDDEDDEPAAPPPPKRRRKVVEEPTKPAPAAAKSRPADDGDDDDEPEVPKTSARIDKELAEIGALFK